MSKRPFKTLYADSNSLTSKLAAAVVSVLVASSWALGGCAPRTETERDTAASVGDQSASTGAGDLAARIDPIVEDAMQGSMVPGISIGVMQNGEVVLAKGYGLAEVENEVPATEHTVYRIGSVTKQFTAAAIMLLVEEGKLELDADLTEFFPDYPTGGRTITVEQLLNHTSGIKGYTEMPEFGEVMRDDLRHEDLIEIFSSAPFEFEPGERYQYNNSAFFLLGVIIEQVTGESYADFIRSQFFDPLGMEDSHYLYNDPIVPRRAEGYAVRNGELFNDAPLSMHLPYAAGSLGSSVHDLLTWQGALTGGEAVSAASFEAMTNPTRLNDGSTYPYGYGLSLSEMEGHRKVDHGGGINGFRAHLAHYPDDDLTIAVLANAGSAHPDVLESRVARAVLGIEEKTVEILPLAAADMMPYVGVYNPGRGPIRVLQASGELRTLGGVLQRVGEHEFVLDYDPYVVVTFEVEGERATTMAIERGGTETVAPRVSR